MGATKLIEGAELTVTVQSGIPAGGANVAELPAGSVAIATKLFIPREKATELKVAMPLALLKLMVPCRKQ